MSLPLVLQDLPDLDLEDIKNMSPAELEVLDSWIFEDPRIWLTQGGPQTQALNSEADEVFYGGQAGGGKTDLIIGMSLTEHINSIIFRREATQLTGIIQRMTDVLGNRDGYNGTAKVWMPSIPHDPSQRIIEFGSVPNAGDETRYQGRPHDLIGFDEICNFLEQQYRFLKGWLRSAKGHRSRVVCSGNPPTTPEGQWVRNYWGPWLDSNHPNPAEPGELRWYTTDPITGEDKEFPDGSPVEIDGEMIEPKSRTFIPSSVEDNLFLQHTGYKNQLAALPEPLRSQMLKGDFSAGMEDDEWQCIPSAAVRAAMDRWERPAIMPPMTAIGIDVARGGQDRTVLARLHDKWMDELLDYPGAMTPTGGAVAALVVQNQRNAAPMKIDSIGVGSSVIDFLQGNDAPVVPINGAAGTTLKEKTGQFGFYNLRAQIYWRFREMLLDDTELVALPNDSELLSDLCAARFEVRPGNKIKVEDKREIKKRIGKSPDKGDAVLYAFAEMGTGTMVQNGRRLKWSDPIQYPDLGLV